MQIAQIRHSRCCSRALYKACMPPGRLTSQFKDFNAHDYIASQTRFACMHHECNIRVNMHPAQQTNICHRSEFDTISQIFTPFNQRQAVTAVATAAAVAAALSIAQRWKQQLKHGRSN